MPAELRPAMRRLTEASAAVPVAPQQRIQAAQQKTLPKRKTPAEGEAPYAEEGRQFASAG